MTSALQFTLKGDSLKQALTVYKSIDIVDNKAASFHTAPNANI